MSGYKLLPPQWAWVTKATTPWVTKATTDASVNERIISVLLNPKNVHLQWLCSLSLVTLIQDDQSILSWWEQKMSPSCHRHDKTPSATGACVAKANTLNLSRVTDKSSLLRFRQLYLETCYAAAICSLYTKQINLNQLYATVIKLTFLDSTDLVNKPREARRNAACMHTWQLTLHQ